MIRYYLIALFVIIVDQISKYIVVRQMEQGFQHAKLVFEWFLGFFYITSHRNRGAAFGILQDQRWFFIIITIIVLVAAVWYMRKMYIEKKYLFCAALGLSLGGAIGNFIDRLLFGEVVDFFHFHFKFPLFGLNIDYHFAIFNVADVAIFSGISLIILDMLLDWRKEKRGMNLNDAK